jgi:hypothetical protein
VRALALVTAAVFVLLVSGLQTAAAPADSSAMPPYDGGMSFPTIAGPTDPEEFSWKVTLGDNQELEAIDDQHAEIYYTEGHQPALRISAESAHDADGSNVPTTLSVSEENVITLTVHHLAGDPARGGTPFDYPILAGPGWEGGFQTVIVQGPPDEAELKEQREREAREALKGEPLKEGYCVVPSLKGKSLRASRRRLVRSGCSLGRVTRKDASAKGAKVIGQSPRAGAVLKPGGSVRVRLGS